MGIFVALECCIKGSSTKFVYKKSLSTGKTGVRTLDGHSTELSQLQRSAKMEKLFDALRSQHPGCDVVDVRFLVNQYDVDDQDVDVLDEQLSVSIKNAKELPAPT